ncbi:MAG: hypothetical protein ABEJ24_05290 [Candidatus Magasanikbacteria bacterium]
MPVEQLKAVVSARVGLAVDESSFPLLTEEEMSTIALHNVGEDWEHLQHVPGIDSYWNRVALVDVEKMVSYTHPRFDFDSYFKDLKEEKGLGPEEIIEVPQKTDSFYDDVLKSDAGRKIYELIVQDGYKLELFSSEPEAVDFVKKLGLDWDRHVTNPSQEQYEEWANKARLREALQAKDCMVCPENYVVESREELLGVFDGLSKCGPVVVKRPDKASGEGQKYYPSKDEVGSGINGGNGSRVYKPQSFLEENWDPEVGAIVEQVYEHHPCSIIYDITDHGPQFQYISLQNIGKDSPIGDLVTLNQLIKNDIGHMGNAVGSQEVPLGPLGTQARLKLRECGGEAASILYQKGYRGKVCFDFAYTEDGKALLLECNPRGSHSWYVYGLQKQLEESLGAPKVVIGCNVLQVEAESYHSAKERLPNPTQTVMFHTPLLDMGLDKCGVCTFGEDFAEAKHEFEKARNALQRKE